MFRTLRWIVAAVAGICAAQTIQTIPTSSFSPFGVTSGPDGALWFTPSAVSPIRNVIGHMTADGATFTQLPLPAGFSASNSPIVTLNGAVWFQMTNGSSNAIARMTTAGAVTQFAVNQFVAPVHSMTVGPDGAIWMTESASRIGRVTTSGNYSYFSSGNYKPYGIVTGPDGNLWFTGVSAGGVSAIGQLTTAGALATKPLSVPLSQSAANPITAGPDGALWFMIDPASPNPAGVGRITTGGSFSGEYTQASSLYSFQAGSIAPGPDGRLWFTGTNGLGEITTDGTMTITIEHLTTSTVGEGIIEGSDGAMWFADALSNQLIRATTSSSTGGTLGVSPNTVGFNTAPGQLPAPQSVQITSTSGTISYGVSTEYTSAAPANWVGLSSTGGSASPASPGSVTISVTQAALTFPPGRYTANVNVNATSGDPTVAVTLNIAQSTLVAPTVMVFGALAGTPAPAGPQDPQMLVVASTGATIAFSYTIQAGVAAAGPSACNAQATASLPSNTPWLMVGGSTSTGSGATGQSLLVSVQPAGLAPGTYVDYINLLPQGSSTSIPVEVYLVVENSPGTFNFSYTTGGSAPAAQTTGTMLSPCGVAAVNIQVGYSSDQNWLAALVNASGSGFAVTLTATPSASMAAGIYYGMVAITDTAGEVSVSLCVLNVTSASSGGGSQTSALPHFAAQDVWTTGIFVINTGTQPAKFAVAFYDDNGNAISLPFSTGSTSNLSGTVPPLGLAYYETGNPSGSVIAGWGQITADPSIVVQALFRRNVSGTYYEGAVPSNPGSNEFVIPFDFTVFSTSTISDQLYTGFAIANLDPVNPAPLTCTARDSGGNAIAAPFANANPPLPSQLRPLGHFAGYDFPALIGNRGTIDCVSTTTIAATALRFLGNDALSSLPTIKPGAALPIGQQISALPHFAAQDVWTTGIFAINTGAHPASFAIAFNDDNGNPISLPFSTGSTSNLSGTVPAQGLAYYETGNPSGPVIAGWGKITADPSIVVQALFRRNVSGTYYEGAVPSNAGSKEFEIPFDFTVFNAGAISDQLYTGFAIANLDPVNAAPLTCTARDSGGNPIANPFANANPPLPPQLKPSGHFAGYDFPALIGNRGTIDCVSTTTIAATVLRFLGTNALSSLPVINK